MESGGSVFRGIELSTALSNRGRVSPGLSGVVHDRDALCGVHLQAPVGVQYELEAAGVDQGVVPGADQHEVPCLSLI
jgi:hypothetical protein